jgi:hypothetical protein
MLKLQSVTILAQSHFRLYGDHKSVTAICLACYHKKLIHCIRVYRGLYTIKTFINAN